MLALLLSLVQTNGEPTNSTPALATAHYCFSVQNDCQETANTLYVRTGDNLTMTVTSTETFVAFSAVCTGGLTFPLLLTKDGGFTYKGTISFPDLPDLEGKELSCGVPVFETAGLFRQIPTTLGDGCGVVVDNTAGADMSIELAAGVDTCLGVREDAVVTITAGEPASRVASLECNGVSVLSATTNTLTPATVTVTNNNKANYDFTCRATIIDQACNTITIEKTISTCPPIARLSLDFDTAPQTGSPFSAISVGVMSAHLTECVDVSPGQPVTSENCANAAQIGRTLNVPTIFLNLLINGTTLMPQDPLGVSSSLQINQLVPTGGSPVCVIYNSPVFNDHANDKTSLCGGLGAAACVAAAEIKEPCSVGRLINEEADVLPRIHNAFGDVDEAMLLDSTDVLSVSASICLGNVVTEFAVSHAHYQSSSVQSKPVVAPRPTYVAADGVETAPAVCLDLALYPHLNFISKNKDTVVCVDDPAAVVADPASQVLNGFDAPVGGVVVRGDVTDIEDEGEVLLVKACPFRDMEGGSDEDWYCAEPTKSYCSQFFASDQQQVGLSPFQEPVNVAVCQSLKPVVLDNRDLGVILTGVWSEEAVGGYLGSSYLIAPLGGEEAHAATYGFSSLLPESGGLTVLPREVSVFVPGDVDGSGVVAARVTHVGTSGQSVVTETTVNQSAASGGGFVSLGVFAFSDSGLVTIASNRGDGATVVVADAVRVEAVCDASFVRGRTVFDGVGVAEVTRSLNTLLWSIQLSLGLARNEVLVETVDLNDVGQVVVTFSVTTRALTTVELVERLTSTPFEATVVGSVSLANPDLSLVRASTTCHVILQGTTPIQQSSSNSSLSYAVPVSGAGIAVVVVLAALVRRRSKTSRDPTSLKEPAQALPSLPNNDNRSKNPSFARFASDFTDDVLASPKLSGSFHATAEAESMAESMADSPPAFPSLSPPRKRSESLVLHDIMEHISTGIESEENDSEQVRQQQALTEQAQQPPQLTRPQQQLSSLSNSTPVPSSPTPSFMDSVNEVLGRLERFGGSRASSFKSTGSSSHRVGVLDRGGSFSQAHSKLSRVRTLPKSHVTSVDEMGEDV